MADNVGYTPGTGATVAADDISGVLHQRVKIGVGTDGVAVDVSSSNPMPVSGTVTANTGLSQPLTDAQLRAATVPISGTVTANTGLSQPLTDSQLRAAAVPVSGTFFQATQPVSAASLPLPSGAATETTLAAVESDTTAIAASVANIDGKNPALVSGRVPVDGSGVTQPVSGTFWQATQPVSIAASVPVTGTFFQATQPVSAAALPLPSGAATDALQTAGNASLSGILVKQDESVGAIEALRMAINSLTRTIGLVQPDTAARMRVAVDSISGSLTLGTVSTVSTVSTLTNQSQVGTFAANDQIPAMMHLPYGVIRRNISVT